MGSWVDAAAVPAVPSAHDSSLLRQTVLCGLIHSVLSIPATAGRNLLQTGVLEGP
jgi:hypothetical protein